LVGNDSANLLSGGGGRDVLIGGLGPDTLAGGDGDDLLVGGAAALDAAGLAAVRGEWSRTTAASAYADRVANLTAGTGLPPGVKLDNTTVADDTKRDSLIGGAGLDWFLTSALDVVKDLVGEEVRSPI